MVAKMEESTRVLSKILQYPQSDLVDRTRRAVELLSEVFPEVAEEIGRFLAYVESQPLGVLEELYTSTFDLSPLCSPYVGYHLFGEGFKRGALLVGLAEALRAHSIDFGTELPDHFVFLLPLFTRLNDREVAAELRDEALLPALDKMVQSFGESGNVYGKVISAVARLLQLDKESALVGGPAHA